MTWRDQAGCIDTDPEVFFPRVAGGRGYVTKRASVQALSLCAGCRVTVECLAFALSMPMSQDFGIWGRTTAGQRDRRRQKQAA